MFTAGVNGIATKAANAPQNATAGANTKRKRSESFGTRSSLNASLSPSASDCSSPCGPTSIGPRRTWKSAEALRSSQTPNIAHTEMKETMKSTEITSATPNDVLVPQCHVSRNSRRRASISDP